jgi:membrane protein required for colicin V production
MNKFDFTVGLGLLAFMGLGFYAGLLRSLAVILGYVAAAPVAVAVTSCVSPALAGDAAPPWARNIALFFVVLLAGGALVGRLLRHGVAEVLGDRIDIVDRIAGALLGALRLGIVVLPVVVMFDRYVPPERQPQFFAGSKLRPYFSLAGQHGINALPADVTVYLDKLTRDRGT